MEKKFGLIGETVSHSFSKSYFDEKFFRDGLRDYRYDLYPLNSADEPRTLLVGLISGKHWSAIITHRQEHIRIISVRRSRTEERDLYES